MNDDCSGLRTAAIKVLRRAPHGEITLSYGRGCAKFSRDRLIAGPADFRRWRATYSNAAHSGALNWCRVWSMVVGQRNNCFGRFSQKFRKMIKPRRKRADTGGR